MMQQLSNTAVQEGHTSDVEPSNNSDSEVNDPTCECKEVDHENEGIEVKEEVGCASKKRTYQKAFITRMSTHSFSSLVAQLNEAQAEAVRSIGFASFLKFDVKQIPGKFSKWLVENFDPYAKFSVTAFDVHATLGVRLEGMKIIKITRSSMDDEYDEVHAMWQKEWKLQKNAPELT
ncbi:hypothetical protein Cgig2_029765 [Carnegiea gigantea]|uniref:Uncharacterized protein n=1 Tax=Carnegiea gigantea TaxID=171969 RepID=A0A9Q1QBJ2_9CARY|nr:hypothetical protein Cgig2_029765 [Carnegiea gigantea]